jgi:hypothetical protein
MTGGVEVRGSAIYHRRGDTGCLNLSLFMGNAPYELKAGDSGLFTVKKKRDDEAIVLQKEMANGSFTLLPEDTRGLKPGKYWYDIQLTFSTGEVCTVAIGRYRLLGDVTTGVIGDETDLSEG